MAGGAQGAGVDTAAIIFSRACGYGGLYVFGRREYHSNIKVCTATSIFAYLNRKHYRT